MASTRLGSGTAHREIMTEKIVLALSGRGANDAVRGMIDEYTNPLRDLGLSVVKVAMEPAELQYAVEQIASGKVTFALTWLGIGQDLPVVVGPGHSRTNVWEAFSVPLLKLHGDSPAYFVDRHSDVPRNSVNLYAAAEFVHFRRRWLPKAKALTAVVPPMPLAPLERNKIDVLTRRKGKLVFLKNGNSPTQLRQLWRDRLPRSVATLVENMADEILALAVRPGVLHIGDLIAEFLAAHSIEPGSTGDLMLFFTAQVDDYLRRVKSQMIVEAMLDLPVLVQGNHWEHVDFSGRRAKLIEGQDFDSSRQVFSDQLGIVDMSPNLDSGPHERVMRGAGSYAFVLTNRQGWLTAAFGEFDDLTFEFNPDSIRAKASEAISHPDRFLDLGIAFGERFREVYTRQAYANQIVDLAELAALQCSAEKPVIQPFFVWPGS
jgi:hypothetical protein